MVPTQTFTITPNTGYMVADVQVDGSSVGAVSSYKFTNVLDRSHDYSQFHGSTVHYHGQAGPGGSISPSGAVAVDL